MLRAAFKGLFSILALVIGGSIIGWVLYNEVVGIQRSSGEVYDQFRAWQPLLEKPEGDGAR